VESALVHPLRQAVPPRQQLTAFAPQQEGAGAAFDPQRQGTPEAVLLVLRAQQLEDVVEAEGGLVELFLAVFLGRVKVTLRRSSMQRLWREQETLSPPSPSP
jgi:hypothetical protein